MPSILRPLAFVLLPAALVFGCGKKDADTASADSAAALDSAAMMEAEGDTATASSPTPQPAATPADANSRALTVEDIERWEKGLAGEMQAVQEAGSKLKAARTQEDTLNAIMAPQESETAAAGARAAGLDEERYKFVRSKLSDIVAHLAPLELGIDTTQIPQAQRDQMRTDHESYLKQSAWAVPPEVVEALKPRASELRKKDLELVVARLKAAGMQPRS
jgi:hypothetical protein